MTIVPDGKDWTWVMREPCPDCGFDPATVRRDDVADRVRATVAGWDAVLADAGARERPSPTVWSPLEYGCHVRDVHRLMHHRLDAMLRTQPAHLEFWDQDAAAVELDYSAADPADVAAEIASAAASFAAAYRSVADDQWSRIGLRDGRPAFTVESLAAYALHDLEHHRVDVGLPAR